jgi:transcriptional regulator with XRE-family HTH domain
MKTKATPPKHKNLSLGAFLREKRLAAQFSQGQLAKALNCNSQFISNWERGTCSPPMHLIPLMMKILNIPKKEILHILIKDTRQYWQELLD